jgi:uncharacterized protein (DUF1810 family)
MVVSEAANHADRPMKVQEPSHPHDPFDLERFEVAQKDSYVAALTELRRGAKRTHWMWFVFPQFKGLGASHQSEYFAIKSIEEAHAYLAHPVLGPRLRECCTVLMDWTHLPVSDILGHPDDLKLRSSMTLFELVDAPGGVFGQVLDVFFDGHRDDRTLRLAGGRA